MNTKLWDRIEERRSRWNVLDHPFYRRWSSGELTRDELALYAGQYRHAVEAIASMSAGASELAGDGLRNGLAAHAAEEASHVALWDSFVEAVGGDTSERAYPETRECVDTWAAGDGLLPTLVRLYAVESGQHEISRIKLEKLGDRYGVDGKGAEYFRVHEQLDVEHARHARDLVERLLEEDEGEDALVEAAEDTFRANWRLLDGVEERCQALA